MAVQRRDNNRRRFFGNPHLLCRNSLPRNIITIGILFTALIFQRAESMPSRVKVRSVNDDDGFVFPGTQHPAFTAPVQERTIKRETSHQGNYVESNGDIVFPGDDSEDRSNYFFPGPAPKCSGKTFCEETGQYPSNYVSHVIKNHDNLKILAGVDVVENVVQRFGDDLKTLCVSEERVIYPKTAENRDNIWNYVLNDENFKQGVRVEICLQEDAQCDVIQGFVLGYQSMCKQKYIYRQLAAITSNGTVIRDSFKLPSSCCCHLKYDSVSNRMNINLRSRLNEKTPILG